MRQPVLRAQAVRPRALPLLLFLALAPAPAAQTQEEGAFPLAEVKQQAQEEQSLVTLEALRSALTDKKKDLDAKLAEIDQAKTSERSEQRLELVREANQLQADLNRLGANFESVATGIDFEEFQVGRRQEIDLKSEVLQLVAPILEELKSVTESPRQIEDLRSSLAFYQQRKETTRQAVARIDELLAKQLEEPLHQALAASQAQWMGRLRDIESQETVARYQLDTRLANRRSTYESVKTALSEFFRTRGLNLLLAMGTAVLVFLGFRWLYRQLRRVSPIHRRAERPFYARLLDVLYHAFTGLMALVAAMLVLFAAGDWVLLAIALLFLLGLAWAGRATIPQFFEQIQILLNLGTVREQERVIYNGLPWRVSRIGVSAILTNPELSGGIVRLPVKELTGMRSRPCAADDVRFPSRRNDYVRLSDGKFGQVIHQSPESVKLQVGGGTVVTYPTLDYLGMNPENLSAGFSISETVGIDYRHQAISTTRVPEVLRPRIEAALLKVFAREDLVRLSVEFKAAAASSLDFGVSAAFRGTVADKGDSARRIIQRTFVEVCNEQGWEIPFAQVVVHQAAGPGGDGGLAVAGAAAAPR